MAVVYVFEVPGATREEYEAVNDDVFPGGELPDGLLHHVASGMENGFRVTEVWESEKAFETYRDERLGPVLGKHGVAEPTISVEPVFRSFQA